jgi:VanZ family protein
VQRWIRDRWPGVLLCVYWIALLTATHWPNLRGPDIPGKDKTEHVLAYGLLTGFVINTAVRRYARHRGLMIALGTVALIAVCGALDEWTQPYFHRTCDLYDWLADMAGAGVVSMVYLAASCLTRHRAID